MTTKLPAGTYLKDVKCPVCETQFKTMRTKSNAVKVISKDEDFCPYYNGLNPIFYEIIVCPTCAFAASENGYADITEYELRTIKNAFKGRTVGRNYLGERNWNEAVDSFKLALLTATARKSKANIIAGICLKISWLYRTNHDDKEDGFVKYAYENYRKAFEEEEAPYGNLNSIMLMYLLGELARRIDLLEDSAYWLTKAIASPEKKENPRIEALARDQFAIVRDLMKKNESADTK